MFVSKQSTHFQCNFCKMFLNKLKFLRGIRVHITPCYNPYQSYTTNTMSVFFYGHAEIKKKIALILYEIHSHYTQSTEQINTYFLHYARRQFAAAANTRIAHTYNYHVFFKHVTAALVIDQTDQHILFVKTSQPKYQRSYGTLFF